MYYAFQSFDDKTGNISASGSEFIPQNLPYIYLDWLTGLHIKLQKYAFLAELPQFRQNISWQPRTLQYPADNFLMQKWLLKMLCLLIKDILRNFAVLELL